MNPSKRIALSLKPEIDQTITELAKLTKRTKTSVINSILIDMNPTLQQAVFALKKSLEGKDKLALSLMQDLIDETELNFKKAQIDLYGDTNGNK